MLELAQVWLMSFAGLLGAVGVIYAKLRRPLAKLRRSLANIDLLVNGRTEERASWDGTHVLVAQIKPAAQRLDDIEEALSQVRAEVTTNGGSSIKDAVKRIESRLDGSA